jgi:radical SAM superfamily enzyme YgiQ (UPF0313 family)
VARVLLISYAGPPAMISSLYPDNGLASLAGTLLAAGHEVRVRDFNTVTHLARCVPAERSAELARVLPEVAAGGGAELAPRLLALQGELEADLERALAWMAAELLAEVEAFGADLVGFKLWSGDGFHACVRLAEALRAAHPGLRIVAGGPAVLYSEHAIFDLTRAFDALVDGEGEEAILALARWAAGQGPLGDAPNLLLPEGRRTRRSVVVDLNALPAPCYRTEIYPSLVGDQHLKLFVLDESRGCPMRCAFCVHRCASGDLWRVKSAPRVAREMDDLQAAFGTGAFRLGGSCTPGRFYRELASELSSRGRRIRLSGFGPLNDLSADMLSALARAGCESLFFGVESFHPDDLRRLGKRVDPRVAEATLRACQDTGIVPAISLIVPLPGQTEESLTLNRGVLVGLQRSGPVPVQISIPGLVPRTRWFDELAAFGFELLVGADEYRRQLARYRIRHIVPPSLWEPLPYRLDGRDFAGYAGLSAGFQRQVAAEGVIVNLSDDMVVLAGALGMGLPAFRQQLQAVFFTLDATRLIALVGALNAAIAPPVAATRDSP